MTLSGWLLLSLGVAVVLATGVDAVWTTLWAGRGAGPLTQVLTLALGRAVHPFARRRRSVLTVLGPLTIVAVVGLWVLLLWAGFTTIVSADRDAVVHATTGAPGDLVDRIYFVGYTIFTQGLGNYVPGEGVWQVTTNLMNVVGFATLTLAITYFVPVVSAVSQRRSFASSVLGLGEDAGDLLAAGWDGRRVDLGDHFLSFSRELSVIVQLHFAYPVLHSFHPSHPQGSTPAAVAVLDDALTLLHAAVPPERRPPPASILSLRSAVDAYIETLRSSGVAAADGPPPLPDLRPLRDAGIDQADERSVTASFAAATDRRRFLLGLVRDEDVPWPSGRGRERVG